MIRDLEKRKAPSGEPLELGASEIFFACSPTASATSFSCHQRLMMSAHHLLLASTGANLGRHTFFASANARSGDPLREPAQARHPARAPSSSTCGESHLPTPANRRCYRRADRCGRIPAHRRRPRDAQSPPGRRERAGGCNTHQTDPRATNFRPAAILRTTAAASRTATPASPPLP